MGIKLVLSFYGDLLMTVMTCIFSYGFSVAYIVTYCCVYIFYYRL